MHPISSLNNLILVIPSFSHILYTWKTLLRLKFCRLSSLKYSYSLSSLFLRIASLASKSPLKVKKKRQASKRGAPVHVTCNSFSKQKDHLTIEGLFYYALIDAQFKCWVACYTSSVVEILNIASLVILDLYNLCFLTQVVLVEKIINEVVCCIIWLIKAFTNYHYRSQLNIKTFISFYLLF